MGCLIGFGTLAGNVPVAEIVGHDDDDVGKAGFGGSGERNRKEKGEQENPRDQRPERGERPDGNRIAPEIHDRPHFRTPIIWIETSWG